MPVRWNATNDLIAFARNYNQVVDLICLQESLKRYALTRSDWLVLDRLHAILKASAISMQRRTNLIIHAAPQAGDT